MGEVGTGVAAFPEVPLLRLSPSLELPPRSAVSLLCLLWAGVSSQGGLLASFTWIFLVISGLLEGTLLDF